MDIDVEIEGMPGDQMEIMKRNMDATDHNGVQTRLLPQAIALVQSARQEMANPAISAIDVLLGFTMICGMMIHNLVAGVEGETRKAAIGIMLKTINSLLSNDKILEIAQVRKIDDILDQFKTKAN